MPAERYLKDKKSANAGFLLTYDKILYISIDFFFAWYWIDDRIIMKKYDK